MNKQQLITIDPNQQIMFCYEGNDLHKTYLISTGKNGMGEQQASGCTPRGWHRVYDVIGHECPNNSVFVGRKSTTEIYSPALSRAFPDRDWILTRIIQLDGLEPGRNKEGAVDSLQRYIYIHGTPDTTRLGVPGSKGCIRMSNPDIIEVSNWIERDAKVYIGSVD